MQIDIDANSRIGSNSVFEGKFAVKGSLRIDGRFEGNVLLVDQLQVGATGRVKANIAATSVVIEGVVIGNIRASRRVLLLSTARVLGDLATPELIIQDGVILDGKCSIGHLKMDNTKTYIESIYKQGEAG